MEELRTALPLWLIFIAQKLETTINMKEISPPHLEQLCISLFTTESYTVAQLGKYLALYATLPNSMLIKLKICLMRYCNFGLCAKHNCTPSIIKLIN